MKFLEWGTRTGRHLERERPITVDGVKHETYSNKEVRERFLRIHLPWWFKGYSIHQDAIIWRQPCFCIHWYPQPNFPHVAHGRWGWL
jgi:hypothetical protein